MLENGWIKVFREFANWRWYKNANTMRLFIHLLITANYEDHDFENITVKRGQRVVSRASLASEVGLTEQQVRTALKNLISTNEITSVSNRKYTIITINNYDEYQQPTDQTTNDQPTDNQLITNDQPQWKKDKKEKKDKNCFCTVRAPSIEEVRAYAAEIHAVANPDKFFAYFSENGWMHRGTPLRNWKAMFRCWDKNDRNRKSNSDGNPKPKSDNAAAYQSFIYNLDE